MNNPLSSFGFKVKLKDNNDHTLGFFQEVSGLSVKINTTPLNEGGVNHTTHYLYNGSTINPITFKRGLCLNTLYSLIINWLSAGEIKRLSGEISILDDNGKESLIYTFTDAIPINWNGPELNVNSDNLATESITIQPESLCIKFK